MAAQAPIVHIPYRGSSAATNDLLGGQIELLFENVPTTIGYIQANKLKALAITGATRSPAPARRVHRRGSGAAGPDGHLLDHAGGRPRRSRRP